MLSTRQHRYDDYVPDESSVCYDKVKITDIHSCNGISEIGYMSRYSTKQFRFENTGGSDIECISEFKSELLNYKDWKIEYIEEFGNVSV